MKKENYEMAVQLRHELHAHPELSGEEVWTRQHLMNFIKANTDLEIHDRGRWFYAVKRSVYGRGNIAFRADMDALPIEEAEGLCSYSSQNPGAGHKCGHDGHSAALAGFALELMDHPADKDVYLLFQHAEETGAGAKECLPFLEENQIEEIYAVHNLPGIPLGALAAREGVVQFASTGMTIHFSGKKSHACYPEDGINPAYAIAEIVSELENLRQSAHYSGMTRITIIQIRVGEHAFGTSAGEGELLLTVRGEHGEELQDLIRRIRELAEKKAKQYQLQLKIHFEDTFADCVNSPECIRKARAAAEKAGISLVSLEEPFRASEDFGLFTKQIPGAMLYIGDGEDHAPIHTAEFDFPDTNLAVISDLFLEIMDDI